MVPKIDLIGHSVSTIVEMEYAAKYPSHVRRMVLAASGPDLAAAFDRRRRSTAIFGLTLGTRREQIVRAALESIAHQCCDLQRAFAADGAKWRSLRIDGGMAANNWLSQDLADMLDVPVERPANVESTSRGAAMLAAVGSGLFGSLEKAETMLPAMESFCPAIADDCRTRRLSAWHDALNRTIGERPCGTSATSCDGGNGEERE